MIWRKNVSKWFLASLLKLLARPRARILKLRPNLQRIRARESRFQSKNHHKSKLIQIRSSKPKLLIKAAWLKNNNKSSQYLRK